MIPIKVLFIHPFNGRAVHERSPIPKRGGWLSRYVTSSDVIYPPLALVSVATCINGWTDHSAAVLDATILGLSSKNQMAAIKRERPDVVGLSASTFTLADNLQVARIVKRIDPEIPVVVCGPHAVQFPFQTLRYDNVDFVIVGDAEVTFPPVLDYLGGKCESRDLKGVLWAERGKAVAGRPPELIRDVDTLPVPDRSLIPYKKYASVLATRTPITTMRASYDCPYRCRFCSLAASSDGVRFRSHSPKRVAQEMQLCAEMGIKEVYFYDDTFTLRRNNVMEFCRLLYELDLDITWDMETRADLLDKKLLLEMKRAGLRRVRLGVESGSQVMLDSMKKGLTLGQIEDSFRMVRECGLESIGYFMLGLPGETREMMIQTLRFSLELDPAFACFNLFTPLPGTQFWNQLLASGDASIRDAWEKFVAEPPSDWEPPTYNENLSHEELLRVLNLAFRSFYLRPRFFFQEIKRISGLKNLLVKMNSAARIVSSLAAAR